MNIKTILIIILISFLALSHASGQETDSKPGEVKLPLNQYNQMIDKIRDPAKIPRQTPADYALGHARVSVSVKEIDNRATANIKVDLSIDVLEDDWVLIPILPSGTPVRSVTVGGSPVELVTLETGMSWSVKKAGSYQMRLEYSVDAVRSKYGVSLPVPVPRASATSFTAKLPGTGLDVAVIPSADTQTSISGSQTIVKAAIPATSGIQVSWRAPSDDIPSISRAVYNGSLVQDAVIWTGVFSIELFNDQTATIKVVPGGVILMDIRADGKESPVLIEDGFFATRIKGQGNHRITVKFQIPVTRQNGPPRIDLSIPPVPVSQFSLTLPGKKEISVTPTSNVEHKTDDKKTTALVHFPMTSQVSFSWAEAVPEDIRTELRANASLYHTVHAEEGVLYAKAISVYEITSGETNILELELPDNIQINRITAASGAISDWRVIPRKQNKQEILNIFLDRKIKKSFTFEIFYDRSILGANKDDPIPIPLLKAMNVQRQRGMVALLASKELTLKPVEQEKVTRVGENQLPAFVRDSVEMTIAHTFKYVETSPKLIVQATSPERKQGKFDAMVNTLISLGDVTMTGAATIEVNVKSGSIMDLQLKLPPRVNFLSLTAPSLRTYKQNSEETGQIIDVQFTQEMEGQFRIEVSYELIMADSIADIAVPTLAVQGAEVEQGRIALEALTAVEVQPSSVQQLSSLDPSELPQQLILKTTNPILLAYKYVHVDPPYKLTLKITRHKEIEIKSAAIDRAVYHTLFTRDGLAVTTAKFVVRNNRKQFLRVKLPKDSKVWSATVDGKPEKPALAETEKDKEKDGKPNVLIKIINSSQGFPVTLIYQTPVSKLGTMGRVTAALPVPDMVVTHSHWDVFLPDGFSYGRPRTDMDIVGKKKKVLSKEMSAYLAKDAAGEVGREMAPLQITVPSSGIHFAFKKIYANQADQEVKFSIPYVSSFGGIFTMALLILGTLMLWIGILFLIQKRKGMHPAVPSAGIVLGVGIISLSVSYLGVSFIPALIVSIAVIVFIVIKHKDRLPKPFHLKQDL